MAGVDDLLRELQGELGGGNGSSQFRCELIFPFRFTLTFLVNFDPLPLLLSLPPEKRPPLEMG